MDRKVLISFLGTGDYTPCNYVFEEKKVEKVEYIQIAMVKIFCENWSNTDKVYILCTETAEKKHWDKLSNSLGDVASITEKINIPECKSVDEIWGLFNIIVGLVHVKDQIIFDITHGFRSLPMVALSVMNYLESTKDANINGIYYGAFEALGSPAQVKEMDITLRNAPIIDLTPLKVVQDWAKAAEVFEKTGRIDSIKSLTEPKCKAILKETRGADESAKELGKLVNEIYNFVKGIEASRSNNIINKDFDLLKENLRSFRNQKLIEPLNEIIDKISDNLKSFSSGIFQNTFAVIDWCRKYGLIQQGYTYLREALDSYLTFIEYGEDNIWDKDLRIKASQYFMKKVSMSISHNNDTVCDTTEESPVLEKIEKFLNDFEDKKTLFDNTNLLSSYRNDINHCGFMKNSLTFDKLAQKLSQLTEYFKGIIKV